HNREELPHVAQYLSIHQDINFVRRELDTYLRKELLEQYGSDLPDDLRRGRVPLDRLIEAVGARRRQRDPAELHRVLASLPCPIYITTNVDNLLANALKDAGKDPQVEICRWNEEISVRDSVSDSEPDYQPTSKRPL